LNFAFAVEIEDPAFTDHVAVSYEDSSGRNYVARTSTQVHIRQNCSQPAASSIAPCETFATVTADPQPDWRHIFIQTSGKSSAGLTAIWELRP
jgi:hypothetical protein